jgi:CBS domain containing-hemolysin-like protein
MDSITIGVVLIIFALVIVNGMYVAAEFAMVGVSRLSIDTMAEEGHRGAMRVKSILDNPRVQDRYIAATQLGVTFASLGLGMYGEKTLATALSVAFAGLGEAGFWTAHLVATIVAVGILTYLHVVLGEMVPKSIALSRPRRAVFMTVPLVIGTRVFLLPLVVALEWVSNRILLLFGIDRSNAEESSHHTEEDLLHIVRESHKKGELRSESGRALSEMFDFSSLKSDDVMVARVAIHGIPLGATPEDISQVLKEGQHTRYPVYEEDLDQIVGMVHIRDLLSLLRSWKGLTREHVRPITFVPETMTLDRVLGAMRRDRTHAVIVMDEQGGTAGILTVKDLFEEVVGTIEEGDVDFEGRIEAYRDDAGRLHVHGTLRVVELAEVLDRELPPTDAETISGYVLLQLGCPAQVGDTVRYGPLRLVVIAVEGRGVKECLVH